jgi:hypothetical protein
MNNKPMEDIENDVARKRLARTRLALEEMPRRGEFEHQNKEEST